MKTAMILTMLVIAGSTIALVPTSSALTCTNYVVHPDPEGLVGCETRYTWIGCNGNEYGALQGPAQTSENDSSRHFGA